MQRIGIPYRLLALASLWLACCAAYPAAAVEVVPFYVGYADPPLSVDRPDSLTVHLAAALTEHSHGRYRFKAVQLPRKRLAVTIGAPDWKGVVAWANPAWFSDVNMSRYSWSAPYMTDTNLVVSTRQHPVEFTGHGSSLAGLRIGTIMGHRYPDLDHLLSTGQIVRDDVGSELQNLQKLKLGRLDVALIQGSSLPFFREKIPDLDSWMYLSHEPRNTFQRYLFTSRKNTELMAFLNTALAELGRDPSWQPVFGTAPLH